MIPALVSRRGSETVEVAFFLALEHALRNVHFEKPVLIVQRACFRGTMVTIGSFILQLLVNVVASSHFVSS